MTFYFAWVDAAETEFAESEHARNDESVYSFFLAQNEGEFATLSVEVINPNIGLLSSGRAQWAWLSYDAGDSAGVEPLFFGRLVGVPQDITGRIVTLEFSARPSDYETRKADVAESLKVAPYWDAAWINLSLLNDPDVVLEARPARYHIDRVTHDVTASDIISGEGVTHAFGEGDITADSLSIEFVHRPANKAIVTGEVRWQNEAIGSIDISPQIAAAFAQAGSDGGFITSYTGEGLERTWPDEGKRIGAGWRFGAGVLERVDGRAAKQYLFPIKTEQPVYASFPLWTFKSTFNIAYEVSRSYTERVRFSFGADVQPLVADAGSDDVIEISLQTSSINEPIDQDGLSPMRDLRWRSYFLSDRGKQSVEYLICLARAQLLARARAVHVSFEPRFDDVTGITLRDNATVTAGVLPGGQASGKVIGYSLSLHGDTGAKLALVTIACAIGRGGIVADVAGDGVYAEDGYVEPGYQQMTGGATAIAGDVAYEDFDTASIDDDGVELSSLTAENSILSLAVVDGEAAQADVLSSRVFEDIDDAINDLNNAHTQVALSLLPLTGGPFETDIDLTVSDLVIPQTIDLEAGA